MSQLVGRSDYVLRGFVINFCWLLTALMFCTAGCGATSSAKSASDGGAAKLRAPELGPVPPLPVFVDDPITPAKLALGTTIYFDKRLSGSGHISCNACHVPNTSFQDSLPLSTPDRSYPANEPTLFRNTLSFLNIVYAPVFRWDGSHTDLLDVVAFPFAEPNMNTAKLPVGNDANDVPAAQAALLHKLTVELPGYREPFRDAFGVDIMTLDAPGLWRLTGRALRAFLTQAVSRDAPFDRWNAGDDTAMNAAAVRGLEVFRGHGRCIACHVGPLFTDFQFHNISSSPPRADGTRADEGRHRITQRESDRGEFLTPTLRSTYNTSPYFHDGSKSGLRDVLTFLSSPAVTADPNHDVMMAEPIPLTDGDISDLIEFLHALNGSPVAAITPPTSFP
jgi:cytochrome c peroxidase